MKYLVWVSGMLLALLLDVASLYSQTAKNLLLIVNEASPVSLEVGQYYAEKRALPESNVLRIKTSSADAVAREDYERQIESPIAAWLARNSAQDSILYIVLTKGIDRKSVV